MTQMKLRNPGSSTGEWSWWAEQPSFLQKNEMV